MIDKQWAQNCLRHNRNSALLSIAGMQLFNSDAILTLKDKNILIAQDEIRFNPEQNDFADYLYRLDLNQIVDEYLNHHSRFMETVSVFFKTLRRSLVKESFEVTKAYAIKIGKDSEFKSLSFYQYARIIRNAISHDFHFHFKAHDLRFLPLTWDGVTLDASLHDKDMLDTHLPPGTAWKLYSEFVTFVNNS